MSPYLLLFFLFLQKSVRTADLNVGTTLFTKADKSKECWSSENMALLTSRMILEDLLPCTSVLTIDSNEFISDLVEYFRMMLETVRKETHGKTKHITLLALTDLLGGYLHHAVLPISKYAYYAGLIDYDSMATLLGLFDELKVFLRSNGQGWAAALPQNPENFDIQKIPLDAPADNDQCDNMIFMEGEPPKDDTAKCDMTVPMPFFDSINQPNSIALPTKTSPLHNVEGNASSYLVMKFFITSFKCLQSKNVLSESLEKFEHVFNSWIDEQIIPRLVDDKFYSAFGGVLRIRATLRKLGASPNEKTLENELDEFKQEANDDNPDIQSVPFAHKKMSKAAMILTAVLITLFVWFILGTMFICYKMRASKHKEGGPDDTTTPCSSLASSKYFFPERAKAFKKKNKAITSSESDESCDDERCFKTRSRNVTIKMCRCDQDEGSRTPGSGAQTNESSQGRLASITEMSEQSLNTKEGSATTGSKDHLNNKVQKEVYIVTETETEETSDPAQ